MGDTSLRHPFRGRTTADMPLTDRFHQNPLDFLDREFPSSGGMVQTGAKEYCLGDPAAARAVLLNQGKLYEEDSDFFTTRIGLFGPRDAQLNIRRESRALLRNFLDGHGGEALTSLVKMNVPAVSEWPGTGNRLVYRYLQPLLLAPDSPPKLLRLLDDIVERLILRSPSLRRSVWQRRILQFRVTLLLSGAIEARQAGQAGQAGQERPQPLDLLDVVARRRLDRVRPGVVDLPVGNSPGARGAARMGGTRGLAVVAGGLEAGKAAGQGPSTVGRQRRCGPQDRGVSVFGAPQPRLLERPRGISPGALGG